MQQLPLLFTFDQVVMGNGFIANVHMSGRALLEEDADEVWITGIAPVGLSDGGPDRPTAFVQFKNGWVSILFDIASEAASFADFKVKCEEFLASEMPHMTQGWEAALDRVRRDDYKDEGLRSEPADAQKVGFDVSEIKQSDIQPSLNLLDSGNQPESSYKKAS